VNVVLFCCALAVRGEVLSMWYTYTVPVLSWSVFFIVFLL